MGVPMTQAVHHPIFSRCYARLAPMEEKRGADAHRRELLADLSGRVVEVGAGTGINFAYYPDTVTEVLAVEPEPYLRTIATNAARLAPVPVTVLDGVADQLPLQDESCDAAVVSLVLCSVPDQASALTELHRVIRPGGGLRFYEYVRASTPRIAHVQEVLDVVWPHLGGGCHASRDTLTAIRNAGFEVTQLQEFTFRPSIVTAPVAPHILGRARRQSLR